MRRASGPRACCMRESDATVLDHASKAGRAREVLGVLVAGAKESTRPVCWWRSLSAEASPPRFESPRCLQSTTVRNDTVRSGPGADAMDQRFAERHNTRPPATQVSKFLYSEASGRPRCSTATGKGEGGRWIHNLHSARLFTLMAIKSGCRP